MKKAVYYGRVSTEEQAINGYSLDMQKEKCIEWANSQEYEIVEFFEDKGISGSKYENLKNLQKLNKYIKIHKVDVLVCWKLDRISRNIIDFYSHTYKIWYNNFISEDKRMEDYFRLLYQNVFNKNSR